MFIQINVNPLDNNVGDCTVRAISHALGQDWHDTYIGMVIEGYILCDMPSANRVWGAYLRSKGYRRHTLSDECPECYTVRDFCRDNPSGTYILALDSHIISVYNGNHFDTWDSGDKTVLYYWCKE